jgi:hypothetical protein
MGNESAVPNIIKKLITECELVEAFHWTFNEIAETPYEKMKFFFLWNKTKQEGKDAKEALEAFKNSNNRVNARNQTARKR